MVYPELKYLVPLHEAWEMEDALRLDAAADLEAYFFEERMAY